MSGFAEYAPLDSSKFQHSHSFLGKDHHRNEGRAWAVIVLCTLSMVVEITCGSLFGSLALVADGIHMSTHAFAFLVTAVSYSYSRKHSSNERFVFGVSKIGELSSYTCALILVGVAGYILYEGIYRIIYPTPLHYKSALPVAFVGLCVNILSACILMCGCCGNASADGEGGGSEMMSHGHSHGHDTHAFSEGFDDDVVGESGGHEMHHCSHHTAHSGDHHDGHHETAHHDDHDHGHGHHADHHDAHPHHDAHHDHGHGHGHDESREVITPHGPLILSIFEEGIPPEFRIQFVHPSTHSFTVTTFRGKARDAQVFQFYSDDETAGGGLWRSTEDIPEPHSFDAEVKMVLDGKEMTFPVEFREHDDHSDDEDEHEKGGSKALKHYERDNNFRGALLHVVADAFVSVLAILAIAIAGTVPQAYFLDPLAGIVGALVIMSWGYQLSCDSMIALLDLSPDHTLNQKMKRLIESDPQSVVSDLHIWKIGPGNLGVVMSVLTSVRSRSSLYYKKMMAKIKSLGHVTVEVNYADEAV